MKKILYILILLIFITSIAAASASDDLNETVILDANGEIPICEDNLLGNEVYEGDWDDEESYYAHYSEFGIIILYENGTAMQENQLPDYKDIQKKGRSYLTFSDAYIPNMTISYGQDILLPITSSFRIYQDNTIVGGSWDNTDKYTTVNVFIDDNPVLTTTITNGRHTVKINRDPEIDVGVHDIKVILSKELTVSRLVYWLSQKVGEYSIYSTLHSTLNVTKSNIHLNSTNTYSKENHNAPIITNVKNDDGENLKDMKIDFYKNNEYIGSALSDENGNAVLNYFIPKDSMGKYNITSLLEENENYFNATSSSALIINGDIHTKLNTNDLTMYYHNEERFTCQLSEFDGTLLKNETLIFEINGVNYTKTTDRNGSASLAINLNPGEYEIKVRFKSDKYLPCNSSNKVTVKNTINAKDLTKNYRDDNQFYATFLNKEGERLNGKVFFNINGVEYKHSVNNGIAKLNINLLPGKYIITSFNPETGEKYSNNITVKDSIKITSNDLTKYYKNGTKFKINLYDDKLYQTLDYIIKDAIRYNVKFNINGVIYERINQGRDIELDINLEPGEYIITIDYNGYKKSNKITVLSTLNATDLEKTYGSDETFNVKLVNSTGQAYANQTVTFNINGIFYNRTTDEHGIARLNINLMPGEYIITSTYNDLNISNRITIKN